MAWDGQIRRIDVHEDFVYLVADIPAGRRAGSISPRT